MEYIHDKSPIMTLRSSIRGTGPKTVDTVSLSRDFSRDPDCYRANSIINDNNFKGSSSATTEDDSCKLGDGSSCHIFHCKSKRCQLQEKFFPQDKVVSTLFIDLIIV